MFNAPGFSIKFGINKNIHTKWIKSLGIIRNEFSQSVLPKNHTQHAHFLL